MLRRYSIIGLVALLALQSAVIAAERPNVVLIYTDDQGYGDASCLNPDSKFATPHLDRLAREGMTFTDAHCSDTVCTPSRYGLLTGRYSWRTELKRGVFGAERACLIVDGRMTLASLLKANGYHTAMVGKWHLGMDFPGTFANRDWSQPVKDMPLDKGFDYYFGIPASMNYGVLAWFDGRHAKVPPTLFTAKKPNDIALSDYRIMPPYEATGEDVARKIKRARSTGILETAPDFVDSMCLTRFTGKAVEYIQSRAEQARAGQPFFVYVPYTSPHKPVIPIERFRGKSGAGAYGDFMIETDWHVGRLLKVLDDERLAENTLIIFTSDNGPENTWKERRQRFQHASNGQFREGKRSIYEGGHRVPFFARWPAGIKAGSQWEQPVCQTDLLATLATMLEVDLPADAGEDSISFYPALRGESSVVARPAMIHHASNGRFALRQGNWKLVMAHGRNKMELYNLATDPGEQTDVVGKHPQMVERMVDEITRMVARGRTSQAAAQENDTAWWPDLTWITAEQYRDAAK